MIDIEGLIKMDRTNPKRLMVVGDFILDMYIHGRMEECQDDCPKFIEEEYFEFPGGAANAGRSLEHWHSMIKGVFDNERCPIKARYMVDDKCVFRHDNDNYGIELGLLREVILEELDEWQPHGLLISDYDKGMLTPGFIAELIAKCRNRNIRCVADPKQHLDLYAGAIVKCNADYARRYKPLSDRVVITRGADAPLIAFNDVKCVTTPVECVNHIGAGDCFASHLLLALVYGYSLKDAAGIAHSAGRVYVQRRHNSPPYPAEIAADMMLMG